MIDEAVRAAFSFYQSRGAKEARIICPDCAGGRKKATLREMHIQVADDGNLLYFCHHCGVKGVVRQARERFAGERWEAPVDIEPWKLTDKAKTYLISRGISVATAEHFRLFSHLKFFRESGGEAEAIGFPYIRGGQIYAAKYRAIDFKGFTQENAAKSLFGFDFIEGEEIVIVEGEMDALSVYEAGITNVVSVPGGAPNPKQSGRVKDGDKRFDFLTEHAEVLKRIKKVVLFTDDDVPGQALKDELARRLGRHLCYEVAIPEGCKDANDILRSQGKEALGLLLKNAKPLPVAGVFEAKHYNEKVMDLYRNGLKAGHSTGYPDVDRLFTIAPGQISIVTGWPGSGKSDFVDQIMVNLALNEEMRFAVWSIENPPHLHISKLAEKFTQKPFRDGPNERMSLKDLEKAQSFIDRNFIFMEQHDGSSCSIDSILERASSIVLRNGARGLVIDPYNYIDIGNPDREDRIISDMLTKVRMWALAYDAHVWFVAHPKKLPPNDGGKLPIPNGNSISGSAAWFSKADVGVTVHRNNETGKVEIHCWKCRFKWIGSVGMANLLYDVPSGTYSDDAESSLSWMKNGTQ